MNNCKVLVVEDEAPKRRHLVEFLKSWERTVVVTESASVTDSIGLLESSIFDLMILDMSLPTFTVDEVESGGRPQGFGGMEILNTIVFLDLKMPVVVVTGFEAFERSGEVIELDTLRLELNVDFGEFLYGVVHFNSMVDGWQHELREHLFKIVKGADK